tara:strand:- start:863 stop:2254 length:1392 start_codon:yes stop_codon:yes gene_type:complete
MAAIITSKFRIHNAESFKEGFSEAAATNMYLGIGRPQGWTNDNSPDTPVDTVADEYYYWDDMLAVKRIQSSDVSHAVARRNWTSGKYYDTYRHDYNGVTAGVNIESGGGTTPASLYEANFFVVTDEYNVYKCLDNRNTANAVVASTTKPTGTSTSPITTADGYVWKFMYAISAADVIKFVSTDFIPVKTLGSNPGSTDAYYDQWLVEAAAVDGSIDTILVTSAGTGYTSAPTVSITGDGTGATATATIDIGSGAVTAITINNVGSGYTFANIGISGGGGASATATAFITPKGGHGFNPVEELGGYYVMMNVRLEYSDGSGDFPIDNDYRRIVLIRDPYNYGTTTVSTASTLKATNELTFSSGSGTFTQDETITGGTSGAVGRITTVSGSTIRYILLRTDNTVGAAFQTAETITGGSSSATGTIDTLTNPEVAPDSGDVIYVENRRPINRASDQIEDIKIIVEM